MKKVKEEKIQERKYYLDLLRILAAFSVVMIHMTSSNNEFGTITSNAHIIYNNITRFAITLFFMISGALFLSKKQISIKKIYIHNILRLLIILAVWLPVYRVVDYYLCGAHLTDFHNLVVIMKQLFTYQYQFWFLFPLIGIYMSAPFLKKIAEDDTLLKYFIVLFIVLIIGRNTVNITTRFETAKLIFPLFTPDLICGYAGYFLIGYYLDTRELGKKATYVIYILGVLSFVAIGAGSLYLTYKNQAIFDKLGNNYVITSLLTASFIFLLFKNLFKNKDFNPKIKKLISFVSKNTLGVYIFHNFFRFTLERMSWYSSVNGPIGIVLCGLVIFVACIIISAIVRKIPFIGDKIV